MRDKVVTVLSLIMRVALVITKMEAAVPHR